MPRVHSAGAPGLGRASRDSLAPAEPPPARLQGQLELGLGLGPGFQTFLLAGRVPGRADTRREMVIFRVSLSQT